MACYPWIVPYERHGQKLTDFPNLKRWFDVIAARPAVVKAYEGIPPQKPITDEERAILFGQTAR
jgi:GSH-dependent disulfide-bond oxidoreductase